MFWRPQAVSANDTAIHFPSHSKNHMPHQTLHVASCSHERPEMQMKSSAALYSADAKWIIVHHETEPKNKIYICFVCSDGCEGYLTDNNHLTLQLPLAFGSSLLSPLASTLLFWFSLPALIASFLPAACK